MKPSYEELQQRIAVLEQTISRMHEQEALQMLLLDNLPLAIAVYDEQGTFIFANVATENFFRLPKGSMVGKTFYQIFPKEMADNQMEIMRQIFATGKPLNSARNINWHGQMIFIDVHRYPLLDENGKVLKILGIGQDITEQTRQEKLLTIQHQIDSLSNMSANLNSSLKKAFLNLMQIDWVDAGGIYLFDEERKTLRLAFSTGLSEDYIRKVSVISSNNLPAEVFQKGKTRMAHSKIFLEPIRTILIREKFKFAISLPLIYKQEVIGSLNLGSRSVEEISDHDRLILESIASRLANLIILVKTREQLLSSNLKLKKSIYEIEEKHNLLIQKSRLESLGELSAGLAHEINQPLSVISLVMENINYKLEQNAASGEYLTGKFITITKNINKIRQLIDHVRIFSRAQENIIFEQVDVNQVIISSLSMIETQFRKHEIRVQTELSEELGYTIGNPSRFEQVILNLLSNARYAVEDKGKKTASVGLAKEIRITTLKKKGKIIIRVWDNGTGISKENLDKIFNPFFTTKLEDQGTGLGLAIAYGIILEMKGMITAQSREGEFTEITITLPYFRKNIEKK